MNKIYDSVLDKGPNIVFIDNSLQNIFRSIDILKKAHKNVSVFSDAQEGINFVIEHPTDILLMNLDLLPEDAVTLTKDLIQRKPPVMPFIVVYTDKQDDFVYEIAFNSGIDSVINFHHKPAVLNLFIKNLLTRRVKEEQKEEKELTLDTERFLIFRKGKPFQLPKKEFRVFELLYNNPQRFFSKAEIAQMIWNDIAVAGKRVIDVHIYNIRQTFGKRVIQSQKGRGYRINSRLL